MQAINEQAEAITDIFVSNDGLATHLLEKGN